MNVSAFDRQFLIFISATLLNGIFLKNYKTGIDPRFMYVIYVNQISVNCVHELGKNYGIIFNCVTAILSLLISDNI